MEREEARTTLDSIDAARRRRGELATPPPSLYWRLALCMVVEGIAYAFGGTIRTIVGVAALVAVFAISFAAERTSGVVSRITRPPSRPAIAWVVFAVTLIAGLAVVQVLSRIGGGAIAFFALAVLIVTVGPRVSALGRALR